MAQEIPLATIFSVVELSPVATGVTNGEAAAASPICHSYDCALTTASQRKRMCLRFMIALSAGSTTAQVDVVKNEITKTNSAKNRMCRFMAVIDDGNLAGTLDISNLKERNQFHTHAFGKSKHESLMP